MSDPERHVVQSPEQLREIVGEPLPGLDLKVSKTLEPPIVEFIERSPFIALSTADAEGHQDVSPKGDGPGFVEVESETSLLIPDRPGNKLTMGLLNILANPYVGLIFLVPGTPETVRVNGRAEILSDLLAAKVGADDKLAEAVDKAVEEDYRTNL